MRPKTPFVREARVFLELVPGTCISLIYLIKATLALRKMPCVESGRLTDSANLKGRVRRMRFGLDWAESSYTNDCTHCCHSNTTIVNHPNNTTPIHKPLLSICRKRIMQSHLHVKRPFPNPTSHIPGTVIHLHRDHDFWIPHDAINRPCQELNLGSVQASK